MKYFLRVFFVSIVIFSISPVFSNQKFVINESDIIATIILPDFDNGHRVELPFNSLKNNSYVKIDFPKNGRLGLQVNFPNSMAGLEDRIKSNLEINLVDENQVVVPDFDRRGFFSNTRSIIYSITQSVQKQSYYLQFSSYDSSLFEDTSEVVLVIYYREVEGELNPSGFNTAKDIGLISKASSVPLGATSGYTTEADDEDISHYYKFSLAKDSILEVVKESGTRFRDYNNIAFYDESFNMINRKYTYGGRFRKGATPYFGLTAGNYYLVLAGYSGYRGNFSDTDVVLRETGFKVKKGRISAELNIAGQNKILKANALLASTNSTDLVFSSLAFNKSNQNQVSFPFEFDLKNLATRCKKREFKKSFSCSKSIQPTLASYRDNHSVSISPEITKLKKKGRSFLIESSFSNKDSRTDVFQPELANGRFHLKFKK
jgi:hypothetical protein